MPVSKLNQPRWWLEHPDLFGKQGSLAWKEPLQDRPADFMYKRAAMVQHAFVVTMRGEAKTRGWDWQHVAQVLPGLSYEQLMRVVRGQSQLSLRHISALSEIFGPLLVMTKDVQEVTKMGAWPMRDRDVERQRREALDKLRDGRDVAQEG